MFIGEHGVMVNAEVCEILHLSSILSVHTKWSSSIKEVRRFATSKMRYRNSPRPPQNALIPCQSASNGFLKDWWIKVPGSIPDRGPNMPSPMNRTLGYEPGTS